MEGILDMSLDIRDRSWGGGGMLKDEEWLPEVLWGWAVVAEWWGAREEMWAQDRKDSLGLVCE